MKQNNKQGERKLKMAQLYPLNNVFFYLNSPHLFIKCKLEVGAHQIQEYCWLDFLKNMKKMKVYGKIANELKYYTNAAYYTQVYLGYRKFWSTKQYLIMCSM